MRSVYSGTKGDGRGGENEEYTKNEAASSTYRRPDAALTTLNLYALAHLYSTSLRSLLSWARARCCITRHASFVLPTISATCA